jgi:pyruvate/2-oxoglutarate dehydrogenase complex dihydrolipoamide dehydrogenase (E3) component
MALKPKYDYDIFIIGGGTAGVRAAEILALDGKRVGIAEPGKLGGFEANYGYGERAPLVNAAKLYTQIKRANEMGIRGGSVGYNYPTLREWSEQARQPDRSAVVKQRLEALGVSMYESAARFIGPHEVALGRQHIVSRQFLIASGSSVAVPTTISGLESIAYLTPSTATDLLKPPKSLFIIGGGKTGVELAGLFMSFGTTVYIAEIAPRLLPEEDADASDRLKAEIEERGGEVLSSTRVTSVVKESLMHRIIYLRGDVEHVIKAEHILLAGGRRPNLDLGLENAEVDYTPLGITVSGTLQTSSKHIYSAGSINGTVRGPEGARYEAELAAQNLIKRDKLAASYAALPVVVYSQPSVARVGVNEGEALRKDIACRTATVNLADTVANSAGRTNGFLKLVADKKGIVIGATAVGCSPDVINSLTMAIAAAMSVSALAHIPFAYGSDGEAVTLAAQKLTESD